MGKLEYMFKHGKIISNSQTKKGPSLTLPRWKTLLLYAEDLTEALRDQSGDKVQYHLDVGQFATANPKYTCSETVFCAYRSSKSSFHQERNCVK